VFLGFTVYVLRIRSIVHLNIRDAFVVIDYLLSLISLQTCTMERRGARLMGTMHAEEVRMNGVDLFELCSLKLHFFRQ